MTRHKQQLLQEQENLLEQIQKRHSTDTNNSDTGSKPKSPVNSPTKSSPKPTEEKEESIQTTKNQEESSSSLSNNNEKPTSNHINSNARRMHSPSVIMNNYSHSQHNSPPNETSGHNFAPHETNSHNLEHSRLVSMLRDKQHNSNKQNKHELPYDRHGHTSHHLPLSMEHMENIKALDNSLFGRYVVSLVSWS